MVLPSDRLSQPTIYIGFVTLLGTSSSDSNYYQEKGKDSWCLTQKRSTVTTVTLFDIPGLQAQHVLVAMEMYRITMTTTSIPEKRTYSKN